MAAVMGVVGACAVPGFTPMASCWRRASLAPASGAAAGAMASAGTSASHAAMASGGSADADTASAAVEEARMEQPCACTRMAAEPDALFHINVDATLYELLGVTPDVGIAEIKQAYKKQALRWHPNRCTEPNAEDVFKRINTAYCVLSASTRNLTVRVVEH